MLDEALDLVDAARGAGVELRLVGGLAVLALCSDPNGCRREHRDLDFVAARPSARRLLVVLAGAGYEENRHVRLASSGALLQVYRPCAHVGLSGRPIHEDDRVDVYLDAFRLHHTLPLRGRLRAHAYTLPAADVLLAKLLRTGMSESDVLDAALLLRDLDVREDEAPGVIGSRYLASVCARDWGLYHDVAGNLSRVAAAADHLALDGAAAARVRTAARGLAEALAQTRKGPRWRLRALLGERLPWYEAVDEVQGERLAVRERPQTGRSQHKAAA